MQDIDRQGSKNVLVMHSFFWLGSVAILAGSFFGAVPWIDSNRLPASMFPPPAELPLGAEYFQIGKAISEGRGFSSPFRVPSGPTAWMPPAIPVLLSGLFLATNRNEFWTAILFHGIGTVCVLGCWFSILRFATKAGVPLAPTTFAFVMCLYSQWREIFSSTHDCPILMFVASLILVGGYQAWSASEGRKVSVVSILRWGSLGGMTSLLSPSLLIGWLATTFLTHRKSKWQAGLAILIAVLIQSPWLVRNYLSFGEIIPIKSNASFEVSLARVAPSGILTPASFEHHPYLDDVEAERHARLGEMEYIRTRSAEIVAGSPPQMPLGYQITQRAMGYFVQNISLMASDDQRVLYAIPFLLILLHMAIGTGDRRPMAVVLAVWIAYGAPYIAISFYERYSVPMLPVRVLGTALGIQSVLGFATNFRFMGVRLEPGRLLPLAIILMVFQISCYWFRTTTSATVDETCYLACAVNSTQSQGLDDTMVALGIAPLPILVEYLPIRMIGLPRRMDYWQGTLDDPGWIGKARLRTSLVVGTGILTVAYVFLLFRGGVESATLGTSILGLSPTIISHCSIAATDAMTGLTWLLAAIAIGYFVARPSNLRAAIAGAVVGVALSSKYSSILLVGVFAVANVQAMWCTRRSRMDPVSVAKFLFDLSRYGVVFAGAVVIVCWGLHGFACQVYAMNSALGMDRSIWQQLFEGRALPTPLIGILNQIQHNQVGHPAMLFGEVSMQGWALYFPYIIAAKSTPIEIFICVFGILAAMLIASKESMSFPGQFGRGTIWVVGLTIVMGCAMLFFTRIQIGFRYVLPVFLLAIIWSTDAMYLSLRQSGKMTWFRISAGVAIALQLVVSMQSSPRYLSYVNDLAGGSLHAYKHMADSNLDWGQDLPTLRSALERLPSQNVVLSYFGTAAPVAYGVEVDILDAERKSPLEGYDFLAISVNHLYGLHATTSTVGFMQTELLQTEPFARAGDSILIYDLRSANKWEIWK